MNSYDFPMISYDFRQCWSDCFRLSDFSCFLEQRWLRDIKGKYNGLLGEACIERRVMEVNDGTEVFLCPESGSHHPLMQNRQEYMHRRYRINDLINCRSKWSPRPPKTPHLHFSKLLTRLSRRTVQPIRDPCYMTGKCPTS